MMDSQHRFADIRMMNRLLDGNVVLYRSFLNRVIIECTYQMAIRARANTKLTTQVDSATNQFRRSTQLRFSKPALMGAGLGFVMGIVFLIFSLFQFDREVSDVKGQILLTVVFVMPFMVLIGLGIGGLWSKLYGPNSL